MALRRFHFLNPMIHSQTHTLKGWPGHRLVKIGWATRPSIAKWQFQNSLLFFLVVWVKLVALKRHWNCGQNTYCMWFSIDDFHRWVLPGKGYFINNSWRLSLTSVTCGSFGYNIWIYMVYLHGEKLWTAQRQLEMLFVHVAVAILPVSRSQSDFVTKKKRLQRRRAGRIVSMF